MKHGVKLESLSWVEAERCFAANPVVVMPLGAAAKEHGPHLPLNNDAIIAGWLAEQLRRLRPVVIAPLINASYYPAFVSTLVRSVYAQKRHVMSSLTVVTVWRASV